jgi:hypothetical protein
MLDQEQLVRWLVVPAIAATVVLYRAAGKRNERRRREWFESVATAFGTRAEHASDLLSTFAAEVDGRRCEVAHRYGKRGWRLVVTIPLSGVSDIYSLVLQPSNDAGEDGLRVRSSGFNPRSGWLNADVRAAVSDFYELAPGKTTLDVEAGTLMCHTADRVEGALFHARVSRLVPVARALERAL